MFMYFIEYKRFATRSKKISNIKSYLFQSAVCSKWKSEENRIVLTIPIS